jgi:hypothetical protein
MITTRTQIKTLLQITDTSKDSLIDELLPIVQDEILDYCNSHFAGAAKTTENLDYCAGDTVTFTAATKTITDSAGGMPFIAGQNIYITGSYYNNGHYTVVTATSDYITVSEAVINETAGAPVDILLVNFPKALIMIMTDMVGYKLSGKENGVTSESISGAISTNYAAEIGSYPETIFKGLNKFRKVGFL